ncbi:MAG TPA: galactose oxidase early set domain-containing protein, partial [Candidatus Didemnitutus sp.]|nr:galactose oxidase early set domain-containing protein [Candidatus Didemnitutus sp.]
LPDGSVMAVGGSDDYHNAPWTQYDENRAVREIEYFVPGGSTRDDFWRTDGRSQIAVPRLYHSTAILLLDGRVMVGGGNVSDAYNKKYLDGKESSFRDIEIVTPDYYDNGLKPQFLIDKTSLFYGDTLTITLVEGSTVNALSKLAMFIRCASFTHAFGYDQRAVQLFPYGSLTSTRYDIRIPNNRNIMPPGYYMLFIVSDKGVPSCGQMVRVGGSFSSSWS